MCAFMGFASKSKFGNRKIKNQFGEFDSKLEYERWWYLHELEKKGVLTDLSRQTSFELIPTQYETIERVGKKGQQLKPKQMVAEHSCCYKADFTYFIGDKLVVEDTKSKATRTPEYIIKRKLMRMKGFTIREITKPTEDIC